ncbi:MAG: hypothetical protein AB4062_06810 [Crocosphaera sp.]
MSSSSARFLSFTLTQKTSIPKLLEGWQYWIELGLISEEGVNARIVSANQTFQLDFKTRLTLTSLIQKLQLWQATDIFYEQTELAFTVKVKTTHPQLLQGLDRWLVLGLLNEQQIKEIASENLTCSVSIVKPLSPLSIRGTQTSNSHHSQVTKLRKNRQVFPKFKQLLQSLMAEISVIWLLLLGGFMVVISSGVLAASWWQKFSAILQYGVLLVYTLGFGFASWWTGQKPNLQLTTQALRIITLLLVPINFWAMDSFPLWYSISGLIGMGLGSFCLTFLTLKFFKNPSSSSSHSLPLLNYLGLSYLHWGWTLPGIPLIATYLAVIGTTIITLLSPNNAKKDNQSLLQFSLTEGVIFYALIIMLVRVIFMTQVNVFQLALAIGLCGWLMGWRTPPKTLWKWVGSSLLILGWFLSVLTIPSQAIAISLLAILWLARRVKYSYSRRDYLVIFLIGLQIHWLLSRWMIFDDLWNSLINITAANNYPFVLFSILGFPYLLILRFSRKLLILNEQSKLYSFSNQLFFLLGTTLTIISLPNALIRTINLILSTSILAYENTQKLNKNQYFLNPLALLNHIIFLLTIISAVNYFLPSLSINLWSILLLGFMIGEMLLSVIEFPDNNLFHYFNKSSWYLGILFGSISYGLFWFNLTINSAFWGLSWFIVPLFLSIIATCYLSKRQVASQLSVISVSIAQALTIFFPETRLLGLIAGTILMVINTRYLRHFTSVLMNIGLGIGSIFFYLYYLNLEPSLWILSGVIITLLLWFIRHVLSDNTSDLGLLYAQGFDVYAYVLSLILLVRLIDVALIYTSATNTLISSIILMGNVTYRSWQPCQKGKKFSLWYSIFILAIVPLPALSLPSWGWIELAIATVLMVIQTQILKQVISAVITLGFILELIIVILEDNGLRYSEEFWVFWLLFVSIVSLVFWIFYHLFDYYQLDSIDYYKKALDGWATTLCTLEITTIFVLRLTTDYLLNNDFIFLISLNLIMIGTAYRSWQKQRNTLGIVLNIIIILIVQTLVPNVLILRLISLGIATILLSAQSYFLPNFFTAFITLGSCLSFRSIILLLISTNLQISVIPFWIMSDSCTLITLWLLWSYLQQKNQRLATLYTKAIDVWGIIFCTIILVLLTLHSVAIYWQYIEPSIMSMIAIFLLCFALVYRTWKKANNWIFYSLGWALELLTINLIAIFDQSLISLAVVNIILGFMLQILGEWWYKKTGKVQFLSSWHILPLVYGALGTALRWNFFNSWTGLTSLGFALIIIGIGRRKEQFKPLIYLSLILFSLSAYELLFYQIYSFSWGDKYLSMAALATTIMYGYRLSSSWLSSYLHLTTRELKIIAHLHWILGSIFLGFSLLYPLISRPLIGLGSGLFLSQYAILEGRNFREPIRGEIWVYLGFLEAGIVMSYGLLNFSFYTYFNHLLNYWIGTFLALLGVVVYTVPWRQWGWSRRPWNLLAFLLPLMGGLTTLFTLNYLNLLLVAICYGVLAKIAQKPRLFYLSLLLINIAAYPLIKQLNILQSLLHSIVLWLSLLLVIIIEPLCQGQTGKYIRYYLGLIATGILCINTLLSYTNIIPGILGLILIIMGLSLRIRAFLFIGTLTFMINIFYQLVILSFSYPLLKWMLGLLMGLIFIWIAASFENRRSQISTLANHWMRELEHWE